MTLWRENLEMLVALQQITIGTQVEWALNWVSSRDNLKCVNIHTHDDRKSSLGSLTLFNFSTGFDPKHWAEAQFWGLSLKHFLMYRWQLLDKSIDFRLKLATSSKPCPLSSNWQSCSRPAHSWYRLDTNLGTNDSAVNLALLVVKTQMNIHHCCCKKKSAYLA